MWFEDRSRPRSAPSASDVGESVSVTATSTPARGFVLLVALGLIAVLSVALVMQLGTTQQVELSAIRVGEDGAARAIAEGCLGYANALVTHLPRPPPDAPGDPPLPPDLTPLFNNLLGGEEARFPPGGPRWGFFRRGAPGETGGGCLIRIEDNSDDPDVVDGGVGRDQPSFDQDLAVVVTAIGMFPVHPTTTAADALGKAHAHVTLRRLMSLANTAFAGVQAGRDVTMENSSRICGAGGVDARRLVVDDSACACGQIAAVAVNLPTSGCACFDDRNDDNATASAEFVACADTIDDGAASVVPAGRNNPPVPELLQANRLSRFFFGSAVTMPPDNHSCPFFVGSDDTVFIWDKADATPTAPVDGAGGVGAVVCLPGSKCATSLGRCDQYKENPVERPCTWTFTAATSTTPAAAVANCAAGETPCWKPVAFLGSAPSAFGDVLARWDSLRGIGSGDSAVQRVSTPDGPALAFKKNRRFFLSRNASGVFGVPGQSQCGIELAAPGPAPCGGCDGDDGVFANDGSGYVLRKQANLTRMPAPSLFIVEGARNILVDGSSNPFTSDAALPVGLITNGTIRVKGRASITRASVFADTPPREFEARIKNDPDPSSSRERCEQAIQFGGAINDVASSSGVPVLSARRCDIDDVAVIGGYMSCERFSWTGKGCLAPAEIVSPSTTNGDIVIRPSEPAFITGSVVIRAEDGDVRLGGFARITDVFEVFAARDVELGDDVVVRGFGTLITARNNVKMQGRALVVSDDVLDSQQKAAATTEVTW